MRFQKSYFVTITLALAICALVNCPLSLAQSSGMRVQIPFDFYVENQLMPAGEYRVATIHNGSAIQVNGPKGNSRFVHGTPIANRNLNKSGMVFHRYADLYFLTELQWKGFDTGRTLYTSEGELLQATRGIKPAKVEVETVPKNK